MIFRSEAMSYFDVVLPVENSWSFVEQIGYLKMVHFMDSNLHIPFNQRYFSNNLILCNAMEEKLNLIEKLCIQFNKPLIYGEDSDVVLSDIRKKLKEREIKEHKARHTLFEEFEEYISQKHVLIQELSQNYQQLQNKKFKECEYYTLLSQLKPYLPHDLGSHVNAFGEIAEETIFHSVKNYYLCGVIPRENLLRLQKIVYRISRSNCYVLTFDLEFNNENQELNHNDGVAKSAYFLTFQIGQYKVLKNMLEKALESVQARPYKIPKTIEEFDEELQQIESDLHRNIKVIEESEKKIDSELSNFYTVSTINQISLLEEYRIVLEKERSIYSICNRMKHLSNDTLIAQIFIPKEQVNSFKGEIQRLNRENRLNVDLRHQDFEQRHYKPPTLFKTSDFTGPFQTIVNTYSVPKYGEVNPGQFTLVSFPYEFGIMFGDIGHGGLLALVGYCLIKFKDQVWQTSLRPIVELRYMLLFMGLFACYCGFVYNDFLAIPWNLFGSCYERTEANDFVRKYEGCTYPFGFDPIVFQSQTEIGFINSFKMKLSVIVGVIHMSFGILMKGVNNIYFKNYLDFLFDFLPQLIFMSVTFGYMCLAIIMKWLQNWGDGSKAPSIIALFINMGVAEEGSTLYGDNEGIYQTEFQQSLFLLALYLIPIMLIPKPLIIAIKHKFSHQKPKSLTVSEQKMLSEQFLDKNKSDHQDVREDPNVIHEEEHELSEIFVHQLIEVIEFILGSVSNTASYLRLWALSLAHGQLAKVFLEMTVLNSVKGGNAIIAMIGFPLFVCCTIGVIMIMDFMECFLHCLRLHWVEFQNKFYKGDGYSFDPLDFGKQIDLELEKKKETRFKN